LAQKILAVLNERLMRLVYRVRFCVFIMAVTATKMSFMIIDTVNTFIVFSSFACSTNHNRSKMKMNLYFFYFLFSTLFHFAEVAYELNPHTLEGQVPWQIPCRCLLDKSNEDERLKYQHIELAGFCNIDHIDL